MEHSSSVPDHVGQLYPGIVYDAQGQIHMRLHHDVRARDWPVHVEYWQCFPNGLSELVRGLAQAILKAERRTLPTLHQIEEQARAVHLELLHQRTLKPEEVVAYREKIFSLVARLKPLTHPGAKSARRQLAILAFFRDSQGRVNLGAFRCRMVKVNDELNDRLARVLGWHGNFVVRYQAMSALRDEYNRTLREVQKRIKLDLHHELFVRGQTAPTQFLRLIDRNREHVSSLSLIKPVKPYAAVRFALPSYRDLEIVGADHVENYKRGLEYALVLIRQMLIGQALDDLILRLEMYRHLGMPMLYNSVWREAIKIYQDHVGEPPLPLKSCSFQAIKAGIKEWRDTLA
jgi:hypothetical protein